ncbi:MAG: hypothetical protein ACOCW2_02955, partial [Chitinivibrionales bacterium]
MHGKVELPPNPDYYFLALVLALTADRPVKIGPVADAPIFDRWDECFAVGLRIEKAGDDRIVTPQQQDGASYIKLPYRALPFPELSIFLLLGMGKTLGFDSLPQARIDSWQKFAAKIGCAIETSQMDETICLTLAAFDTFKLRSQTVDPNDTHAFLGLAIGAKKPLSFVIEHIFSSPLRHIADSFGYDLSVKSNAPVKENDPLARRIRMMQQKKKMESKQSFTVAVNVSGLPEKIEQIEITLPGDDLLGATLLVAKSLVQKGGLVIANMPLETWNCATLSYIRKMGCKYGIQEGGQTSFGRVGMVQLQRFKLIGRKTECTPLFHYRPYLPAMVVLSTFAAGQSVFRALEELRYDEPDPIEQMLACVRLIGGRHGEMPDGMVID